MRTKRRPIAAAASSKPPAVQNRGLAKGLELIETLASARKPLSLGELATAAGLGKASTLRLLRTLEATGFAGRDPAGGLYSSATLCNGNSTHAWESRLLEAARPEMAALAADLAETVSLAVLRQDHVRVIHTVESPRQVRMSNYLNRILPPYSSSLGKAIAAFQEPADFQVLLQVYGVCQTTPRTIVDPVQIRIEMDRTRSRGYSFEYEESVPGGCCFGAPVRTGPGAAVRAAVSISLPTSRFEEKLEKTLPKLVMQLASRIARNLPVRRIK